MDIKNFFQKIFISNKEIQVPEIIKQNFKVQFSDSLNTEWQKNSDNFEVVFYKDELEHIATYNNEGIIICMKINLPLSDVPEIINQAARNQGELMNAILIECNESKEYELIVRDKQLIRYTILLDDNGSILYKEKL